MRKILILIALLILVVPFTILGAKDKNMKLELGDITKNESLIINSDIDYNNLSVKTKTNLSQEIFTAKIPFSSEHTDIVLHDKNPGYATVSSIATDYEEKTGKKVFAAVNADFFWANLALDHYIKDGEILHKGLGNKDSVNFGFNNNGDISIGKVSSITSKSLRVTHSNGSNSLYKIDGLGGIPFESELYVYPEKSRIIAKNSAKYLIKLDDDYSSDHVESYSSGVIARESNQVLKTDDLLIVPEGYYGLTYTAKNDSDETLKYLFQELQDGTKVEIIESATDDFEGLRWGVGAKNILVNNNIIMPEPFKTGSSGESNQPRTTLGITNDNQFFIQVIDGRNPGYSSGVTTAAQAQLAFDFGAKSAVELDGGGSSTFVLRVDDKLKVMNKPSDGKERTVINAVLFTEKIVSPKLKEELENKKKTTLIVTLGVIGIITLVSVVVFILKKTKKSK